MGVMRQARAIVSYWMRRANAVLQIGGVDMDCEMDEICFRSKKCLGDDLEGKVVWWRYLAAARRGSSLVYVAELEDRITAGGQGGGGKISDAEVEAHVLRGWLHEQGQVPRPLVAPWSIIHTDGAEAYRRLHRKTGSELYRSLN